MKIKTDYTVKKVAMPEKKKPVLVFYPTPEHFPLIEEGFLQDYIRKNKRVKIYC
jgi:hypothetical protein